METLTFLPSAGETISGIPNTVEIIASGPSTIYYTIDGTLPTLFSSVYVDPVELPTDENSITLSAIAYALDGYGALVPGPILTNVYFTDHTALDRTRYIFFEGVVYIFPGGSEAYPFYYDQDGNVRYALSIPPEELEFIEQDYIDTGEFIGTDNAVDILPPEETPTLLDDQFQLYDTPNGAETFNPEALFIEIDGREGAAEQTVQLINGPRMTLRNPFKNYGGIDFYNTQGTNYISGSSTKYHYDRQKGVIVFYYFDSNNGQWVKSIQDLKAPPEPARRPSYSPPLVFKWFNFGRQQAL